MPYFYCHKPTQGFRIWRGASLLLSAFILSSCGSIESIPTNSSQSTSGGGTMGSIPSGASPMPSVPSGSPSTGGSSPSGRSDGASIDDLDTELDDSLDKFDERVGGTGGNSTIDILDPMGGSPSEDPSQPIYEEFDVSGDSVAGRAEQGPDSQEASDGSRSSGNGGAGGGSSNEPPSDASILPLPDDIGDGRGDNIVERQLREAASRETDPVLQEKLWDEYRRVKGQG